MIKLNSLHVQISAVYLYRRLTNYFNIRLINSIGIALLDTLLKR